MDVLMEISPDYEAKLRAAGLTTYNAFMTTTAGEALVKPGLGGRERIRLRLGEETVYLKRYGSVGPAVAEKASVTLISDVGLPTMRLVAWGIGDDGGFVMVTEVPGDALSRRMDALRERFGDSPVVGDALAGQLGELAAKLHRADLVHRDLYADHIFVDVRDETLDLYLIDLARVFPTRRRRWRWRLKDLAALKYSLPSDWTALHWRTLLRAYQDTLARRLPPWAALIVAIRVRRMARHDRRRLRRSAEERDG